MKDARNQENLQSKQMVGNKPRPEIRDNLDSRENLEVNDKSGHNVKDVKSAKKSTGNKKD